MTARRRKIVHVTSVHRPDDPRILHKECRTLAEAGYDVVLLARHGISPTVPGVTHVPLPVARGRLGRMWRVTAAAIRAAWRERADLYHVHDPELIPGALLLKAARRRVLYDAHEDLPRQILSKAWIPGLLRPAVAIGARFAEMGAGRLLDGVVAATPPIAARFPRAVVVENYPRIDDTNIGAAVPHGDRRPLVVYVGGVEVARGAVEMVDAIALLPAETRLLLAGPVRPPDLVDRLEASSGWSRVEALGWVPPENLGSVLARSRVGLCVLHPLPNYLESLPTKLFEYMAAGLPVVASDFPAWRSIVASSGCGLLVDPRDPAAIASAVARLLDDPAGAEEMGRRGREAVERDYRWDRAAERLLARYRELLGTS